MDIKAELEKLIDLQRKESTNNFQRVIDKVEDIKTNQAALTERVEYLKEKVDTVHKTMTGNGNPNGGCIAAHSKTAWKTTWNWRILWGTIAVLSVVGIIAIAKNSTALLEVIK